MHSILFSIIFFQAYPINTPGYIFVELRLLLKIEKRITEIIIFHMSAAK